jgi:hypothetical protein
LVRNLLTHVKDKTLLRLMYKAMARTTKPGCLEDLETALSFAKSSKLKVTYEYLKTYWKNDPARWGMFARQHSSLLLQNSTTNPIESYHRDIKMEKKIGGGNQGFHQVIGALDNVLSKKLALTEKLKLDSHTKKVGETKTHPYLGSLPHPFQVLVVGEIHRARERHFDGKEVPDWLEEETHCCNCPFYRKYLLPCRHFFHLHEFGGGFLTDEMWQYYVGLFEEQGYEAYYRNESVYSEKETPQENPEFTQRKAESFGKLETIRSVIFDVHQDKERWTYINSLLEEMVAKVHL